MTDQSLAAAPPERSPSYDDVRYAALFAQAGAGLSEVDETGRFTVANDRFCEITGRARGPARAADT